MDKDVVERISFSAREGRGGELIFSYIADIEETPGRFVEPRISSTYGSKGRESHGILWLMKLVETIDLEVNKNEK
jgi:hypothetical protein